MAEESFSQVKNSFWYTATRRICLINNWLWTWEDSGILMSFVQTWFSFFYLVLSSFYCQNPHISLKPYSWYYEAEPIFLFFFQRKVISCSWLQHIPYLVKINELISFTSCGKLRKTIRKSNYYSERNWDNNSVFKTFPLWCISLNTKYFYLSLEGTIINRYNY